MDVVAPLHIDETTFMQDNFTLPSLPEAVLELQNVIQSKDVNIKEVCGIITREPSLSATILKIVNSAYYGFRREVEDVKFAVAYLGMHEIYNISLTVSVLNKLGSENRAEMIEIRHHSIFTALCARVIAKIVEPLISPESLWTPAILHDIGKLVYLKFFPDHYFRMKQYAESSGVLFSHAEKYFEFPPTSYVGGLLCSRWRLPKLVRFACVIHQYDTLEGSGITGSKYDFLKIITTANIMATLASRQLGEDIKKDLMQQTTDLLDISDDQFLDMMGEIYDIKERINEYLW